ncbi:MAG: uroporphyrinogen decarboxylase family protein [Acetivibrionales bacterium]|jgi:uroporphyrinogen decarboxylase
MNSREIVLNSIDHKTVDRVPIGYMHIIEEISSAIEKKQQLNGYEEMLQFLGIDYRKLKIPYKKNPPEELREEYRRRYNKDWPETDVKKPYIVAPSFGIEDSGSYSGAIAKRPFEEIDSIKDIENFPWPDPMWLDYDALACEMDLYPDKAIVAPNWSPVFGTVCEFFGMENALVNMILEPQLIEATIEHITNYYLARNKILFEKCKGKFDIFLFGDDFATDKGLLFSLDTWKKFFKKPMEKLTNQAKSYGLKVLNHCCGVMVELIPEYIALGIDMIEPCQFHLPGMSAKTLSREFGKDICFYGGIDTQYTLSFGTPEDVRRKVREIIDCFPNGGYTVGSDHTFMLEFPLENILALHDEVQKYGTRGF